MSRALTILGACVAASLFGVVTGVAIVAPSDSVADTLDVGLIHLGAPALVMIPIANARPMGTLEVQVLGVSCGCAATVDDKISVPPRSTGVLRVALDPKPPQSEIGFSLRLMINGRARTIGVIGSLQLPFDGYPAKAVITNSGDGPVVMVSRGSERMFDHADVVYESTGEAVPCRWDPHTRRIGVPLSDGVEQMTLRLWSMSSATPVWSSVLASTAMTSSLERSLVS